MAAATGLNEQRRGFLVVDTRAFDISGGQVQAFSFLPEFTSTNTTTVVPVASGLAAAASGANEPEWVRFLKSKQRKEAEIGPYCSTGPRNFIEHPAIPRDYKRIVWEKCNGPYSRDVLDDSKTWDRLLNIFTFLLGKKFASSPQQKLRSLLVVPGQTPTKCFFRSALQQQPVLSGMSSARSTADLNVLSSVESERELREQHRNDPEWNAALEVEALLTGLQPGQVATLGSGQTIAARSEAEEAAAIATWKGHLRIQPLTGKEARSKYGGLRQVGEGGFSRVFLTKQGKKKVAVKKVRPDRATRKIIAEIASHQHLKHPNIVEVYCSHEVDGEYWIIMEALEGGNLYVARKLYRFNESQIAFFAREVLRGLAYIHRQHFVHRDITTNNIMLSSSTGEIRIIDFGLSLPVVSTSLQVRMSGTPISIPPEAIQNNNISCAADIWGLGMLILELIIGKANVPDSFSCLFSSMLNKPPIPIPSGGDQEKERWSDHLIAFLHECLNPDPNTRATAVDLLNHNWFTYTDIPESMKPVLMQIFVQTALTTYGF